MGDNVVREKSFSFAVKVVKACRKISDEKKEFVLSKQLMRSGTSIGANVREAINAQSKADFIHKLAIAQKESDETIYWLELMKATDFIGKTEFDELHTEATEILRIIRSIILSTKRNS
ncbi:four helix bundle protein [Flavobacterium sp. MAH-1]|uniref:Four helix bundle protein n=1 Tax=Flavobacterium agri TaxID=2743471 RepID=A0A7Y8Y466_9FLAO|nr:four helix bundle protein [Flavobacterium agri]NUY80961.1 four helix bundle protein [Flavobacterium agri]NYA70985.1 four helix bundle protein [Flavobacterium agri]